MTRRPVRWLACAAALVGVAAVAAEPADAVRIGFDGRFRAGSWTPVTVTDAPDGDVLHVAVQDPDGAFVRSPPAVSAGGRASFHVRCGRPGGRLRVENATTGEAAEMDLPTPLPATAEVWLLLGDLPALGRVARLVPRRDGSRPAIIGGAEVDGAAAGGSPRDFDGVDTVVACGRALTGMRPAVVAGIDAWIRDGGRLVLVAGASAEGLAGWPAPADGWLPGAVERMVPLRGLAAVETHARASGLASRPAVADLRVPLLADRKTLSGAIDVFEGGLPSDLPIVVRRAHGLGSITWIGLDLDVEPFRGWPGTDTLLVRLLERGQPPAGEWRAAPAAGPPDLAGQLRLALEAPGPDGGIAPVSFALVAGLGLLYVACIFPLDWWLVSRGARPWLAWISLPALVAAFTAAAWSASARARAPAAGPAVARYAEVIDVDAAAGAVRGRSWLAAWRGANAAVDAAVAGAGQGTDAAVSWFADAGPGFGAIDAAVAHPTLATADYGYGRTLAGIDRVPVAAVSSRLFEAGWSGTTPAPVTADLVRDGQGTLRGSFAHHLPFTLRGCRLAHGGWLYDVGDLAPDERHALGSGRGPRSLAGALTRREAVKERDVTARWDRGGNDLERILEVAGFHAAAGGSGYTGLESGRLARLDLSPLLPLDRAVLLGTAADPPAAWTTAWRCGDAGGTAADRVRCAARLYRIVIPLGAAPAGSRDAAALRP